MSAPVRGGVGVGVDRFPSRLSRHDGSSFRGFHTSEHYNHTSSAMYQNTTPDSNIQMPVRYLAPP